MNDASRPSIAAECAAGPFRVREVLYPADFRQPRHAHTCVGVTVVLSGVIRETAGRSEETASALSIVVKPEGVEHADEVGPAGLRTLQILFDPRYACERLDGGAGIGAWRWLHGAPAARDMIALLRLARGVGGAPTAETEDAVLDVLGGVTNAPAPSSTAPGWLLRAREELDDRPTETVRVRDLAASAEVHPVSLARAFRRHYGSSITEYRKRQRLRHAARAVAGGRKPFGRIAYAAGFADQPHFCREFREATGVTPSEYHRLVRHL